MNFASASHQTGLGWLELNGNLDCAASATELEDAAQTMDEFAKEVSKTRRLGWNALAAYARKKADAMRARLAGNIVEALRLEAQLDIAYNRLPGWAKW